MEIRKQFADIIHNFFFSSPTSISTDIKIIEFEVTKEEFKGKTLRW